MTNYRLSLVLAASALAIATTSGLASTNGLYWVVGNSVTNSCDIVSQHPVVSPEGPLWFGNGPYKSYDDARLARREISACPRSDETASR